MQCIRQRLQKRRSRRSKGLNKEKKKDDNDEDDEEEKEDEVEEGLNTTLTPITWTGLKTTSNTLSQFFFP